MKTWVWTCLSVSTGLLVSCSERPESSTESANGQGGLYPVTLQLDWYPESAHGGFYQAQLKGYYAAAGLEVEIKAGGPGVLPLQTVATRRAEFTISRIDDALIAIDKGLPLILAMSYMQRDPQAIMFHSSNPIESWSDLDGKSVMLNPGNAFVEVLRKRHGIDFGIIPLDYGIQRFLADENFIQQCFVTSQPFFAQQQGIEVGALLMSDDEYSPERVVIVNTEFAQSYPQWVEAFVSASILGWQDYMEGDPLATHVLLDELNPANSPELNRYSRQAMADYQIVFGDEESGEALGLIDEDKLARTIETLRELQLLESEIKPADVIDYSILPDAVARPVR